MWNSFEETIIQTLLCKRHFREFKFWVLKPGKNTLVSYSGEAITCLFLSTDLLAELPPFHLTQTGDIGFTGGGYFLKGFFFCKNIH
jgi:hypothetical protein